MAFGAFVGERIVSRRSGSGWWLALACAIAAASPGTRATGMAGNAPQLEPAPCAFEDVDAGWARKQRVECGWLRVPEARTRPGGRELKLWVAIARADPATRVADPILYLHGGPGIATVDTWFPFFPESVAWGAFRKTRDIVFFDQRGTGRSQPALCPDVRAQFEALEKERLAPSRELEREVAIYSACRRTLLDAGTDVDGYSSDATAEDAEHLRKALGYPAWNVYGTSYGTFVALRYLQLHPRSIRSLILDSPYPPNSTVWAEQGSTTAKAFEAVVRACRAQAACARRFPDLPGRLDTALARLNAHPLTGKHGAIDGDAFVDTLWTMLVRADTMGHVPLAIDEAAAGKDATVRALVDVFGGPDSFGSYSPVQALAVNCYEGGRRTDASRDAKRRWPQFSGQEPSEAFDQKCAALQPNLAPPATFAPVAGDAPVLLYTGEFDPATPPDDALQAVRFLPHGTIVPVKGASHAPFYSDDCTRGIAHAFLAAPSATPDLSCLSKRAPFAFATEGMDALLRELTAD